MTFHLSPTSRVRNKLIDIKYFARLSQARIIWLEYCINFLYQPEPFHLLERLDCNDDITFQLVIQLCHWYHIKAMQYGVLHKITKKESYIWLWKFIHQCKISYDEPDYFKYLLRTISNISQSIGSSNSDTGFEVQVLSSNRRGTSICKFQVLKNEFYHTF